MTCCNQNKPVAKLVDDIESHSHSHTCGDQHSHHSVVPVSEIQNVSAATDDAAVVATIDLHCAVTSISTLKEENQMSTISEDVECQESTSDSKSNDQTIKDEEDEKTQSSSMIENLEVALPLLN